MGSFENLGYRELFTSAALKFANSTSDFENADFVILGFPFDGTSTYRSGSRYAPNAIREASLHVEPYSLRSRMGVGELRVADIGNLDAQFGVEESLKRLQSVVQEILDARKTPIVLGGEHTLTLGVIRALKGEFTVVSFDAHADLRDEFMGNRVSHATVMRRILDRLGPDRILLVGTRALCQEEIGIIERKDIKHATTLRLLKDREESRDLVEDLCRRVKRIYLTIDFDVLDPAYAPAVANPEPDGIDFHTLLELLSSLPLDRVVGFDVCEIVPHYGRGTTALEAARVISELLCGIEISRRRS